MAGYHTCALLSDTTVKCFGDNAFGQLGVGDTTNRNTPTAVPGLTGVVQLGLGGASPALSFAAARVLRVVCARLPAPHALS